MLTGEDDELIMKFDKRIKKIRQRRKNVGEII